MEIETIIQELKEIGALINLKHNTLNCYLFGSVLTSNHPNDIDILVLYDNLRQLEGFKEKIKPLKKVFPLHLNYFTFSEEKELNFVKNQNAEQIF